MRWLLVVVVLIFSPLAPGCGAATPAPDGQAVAGCIRVGAAVAVQLAELAADLAELWSKCQADPEACDVPQPPPAPTPAHPDIGDP